MINLAHAARADRAFRKRAWHMTAGPAGAYGRPSGR